MDAKIVIEMSGELPLKAFNPDNKKWVEESIQNAVIKELGEYEIWGEAFGDDENVYALFLDKVELIENSPHVRHISFEEEIANLKDQVKQLEEIKEKLQDKIDDFEYQPTKYSINELDIQYTPLPFCEHCGENHTDFGVEITEPNGGTAWCLGCFLANNELCEQDIKKIEKSLKAKRATYFKNKAVLEGK